MSSTNKTPHYLLNQWVETDKPTRADFVLDNSIIDTYMYSHFSNQERHLTADEKARVGTPYQIRLLQGTGASSRNISFNFEPQFVIYFAVEKPMSEFSSSTLIVNSCVAVGNYGGCTGCSLSGDTLTVLQGTVNGVECRLNNSGYQYLAVAFR